MKAHPPPLVALREHDDDRRFLLQNHLPEIVSGFGQRALGGNVLLTVSVALTSQHKHRDVSHTCRPWRVQMFLLPLLAYSQVCSWRWCSRNLHHCASRSASPDWSRLRAEFLPLEIKAQFKLNSNRDQTPELSCCSRTVRVFQSQLLCVLVSGGLMSF